MSLRGAAERQRLTRAGRVHGATSTGAHVGNAHSMTNFLEIETAERSPGVLYKTLVLEKFAHRGVFHEG